MKLKLRKARRTEGSGGQLPPYLSKMSIFGHFPFTSYHFFIILTLFEKRKFVHFLGRCCGHFSNSFEGSLDTFRWKDSETHTLTTMIVNSASNVKNLIKFQVISGYHIFCNFRVSLKWWSRWIASTPVLRSRTGRGSTVSSSRLRMEELLPFLLRPP